MPCPTPESDWGDKTHPLHEAIESWHEALSGDMAMTLRAGLAGLEEKTLRIGTGFSGSEITGQTVEALLMYWNYSYGISVRACEMI